MDSMTSKYVDKLNDNNLKKIKIKANRKYMALLFLVIAIPLMLFGCIIIETLIIAIFFYIKDGNFIFDINDLYSVCKLIPLGIPAGIVIWFAECRRYGIKIFGK